jgi:hypothetical protein
MWELALQSRWENNAIAISAQANSRGRYKGSIYLEPTTSLSAILYYLVTTYTTYTTTHLSRCLGLLESQSTTLLVEPSVLKELSAIRTSSAKTFKMITAETWAQLPSNMLSGSDQALCQRLVTNTFKMQCSSKERKLTLHSSCASINPRTSKPCSSEGCRSEPSEPNKLDTSQHPSQRPSQRPSSSNPNQRPSRAP